MAAISAAIMGYVILSKYIFPIYKEVLGMIGTPTETGTLVALLIVVIVVVILKSSPARVSPGRGAAERSRCGGVLHRHGGFPYTQDPLISVLSICLAVMVSHSRLLLHIHSLREVVLGAVTGTVITVAVMMLFMRSSEHQQRQSRKNGGVTALDEGSSRKGPGLIEAIGRLLGGRKRITEEEIHDIIDASEQEGSSTPKRTR